MKSLFSVIIITFAIAIGCDTPYTNDFLGNGMSVDDIVDDLDQYAVPGECVTDGFDWLCRGETHIVTLEVIREVEVRVEVEVIREVEVPIERKELYAVIVEPNQTIQTPVGVIQTDATGAVVSAPEGVRLTSVTVQEDGGGDTSEKPDTPQGGVDGGGDTDNTPEKPNLPQGGGDGHSIPQSGGYVVYSELVNGRMQSGVIHSDYVVIENGTITFTGQDGEVDPGDTVREYVKVETGLTYEQASERAPEILSE